VSYSNPNPSRPRWLCIHAPPAPTFQSGSWVTATVRPALSPSIVRDALTPMCALLSRKHVQIFFKAIGEHRGNRK
jgi:hypothetical protein